MGRIRSMKRLLGRMQRNRHSVVIPQPDGEPPARFTLQDLAEAYVSALDRELGEDVPDHPLSQAARRSPDMKWRHSVYAGGEEVGEPVEDLSEPG